jgi:hypothetical protein
MNAPVKFALLLIAVGLLLTSCSHRDADLSTQIVGTWTNADSGIMAITSDGRYSSRWASQNHTSVFGGTWKIRNGVLIASATNGGNAHLLSASEGATPCRIVVLGDHQLIYEVDRQRVSLFR